MMKMPGFIPRMEHNKIDTKTHSPGLGEHNKQVYEGLLGLTEGQMEELKEKGVI